MRDFVLGELRRFANTVRWSVAGWRAAWSTEKSLRQWTVVNVLSAVLVFALDLSAAERAVILALGLAILAAELFNTAIEEIVDRVEPRQVDWARKAKDCGSAGVALVALAGGAAWLVVLAA
ncbi:MAG: diacylglycerol kinase [Rhodobacteraceae bacterium]|nr:diacylglycerol kinase [Paracoccaceae bacterium]